MQAMEDGAQAGLLLGHAGRLVPQLRDLTSRHPLRERFHAQLMLALVRSGRRAEALAAYQHARRELTSELGIEPGPELRDLHERILAGDPVLLAPPRPEGGPRPPEAPEQPLAEMAVQEPSLTSAASDPPPAVPRELPAAVRHFAGREGELLALTRLMEQADGNQAGMIVISAIGGMAGVGKTALALHWAHRVAHRFPDGQLYVDLRGFDPSGTPATPQQAIRGRPLSQPDGGPADAHRA
jgi:hypothetical protein